MTNLLFHKDKFIPDFARIPLHEGTLSYARHAKNVASEGGAHKGIELPATFLAKNATLIEAEVNPTTGKVEKQVWRQRLNDEWDLCFPMMAGGFVKTVWLNHRTDKHKTLNQAKFVNGYQWRTMRNKLKGSPVSA